MRGPAPTVLRPLGNAPRALAPDELDAWKEIAAGAPDGVLTAADRISVELAACLLAEFRRDRTGFRVSKLTTLQKLLASFGLTPAGRLGLALPLAEVEREVNPFDAFHS
ncbi:MAG: hypothetical protein IPJ33_05915 [Gammaproteobacteria bacterium]|nr:hypothetical protein [Gammaproteobacteria bacterium]